MVNIADRDVQVLLPRLLDWRAAALVLPFVTRTRRSSCARERAVRCVYETLLEVHISSGVDHSPYSKHLLGLQCQQLLILQIELQAVYMTLMANIHGAQSKGVEGLLIQLQTHTLK